MSIYTTGEMAKACDVSVRTVQFYDVKDILKPSELTEGGRRLYTDSDLEKLRLICLLKNLGLSLDSIKGILGSDAPEKVLLTLLNEQERQINEELRQKQKQKEAIEVAMENLRAGKAVTVNNINDTKPIMEGKKKLKRTYATMLTVGIILDIIEIFTIIIWIQRGIWWPFAVGMPLVIVIALLLMRMYYKNTEYICPECGQRFKPGGMQFFFARHTLKTRKLTCTHCGYNGYCVETYSN